MNSFSIVKDKVFYHLLIEKLGVVDEIKVVVDKLFL